MNLFYQRTYLVLGMFFVFVGAYTGFDAGISYQTTTTVIVIIVSIGFVLGGIYIGFVTPIEAGAVGVVGALAFAQQKY